MPALYPTEYDLQPALLPVIDAALAVPGQAVQVPPPLQGLYVREQLAARRPHNRLAAALLIVIFDLFLLAQFRSAPELLPLSAALRLLVTTPLGLAFLLLDRANRLGRFYDPLLVAISGSCGIISAILCLRTTSLTSLADIRATTLILLTTGLVLRLSPRAVLANALLCGGPFIASIILSPIVPRAELGGLILTELANAVLSWGFSRMLEQRDRRLFLLRTSDQIRRAELAAQNQGLRQENSTDALTGCANRRCFDAMLAAAWAEALRAGKPLGLVMMDIDHFKAFNDHYGHLGGDDCLARVAAQARAQIRAGDLMARYGGEEFAVIMVNAPLAVVAAAAERIREAVATLALPHAGIGGKVSLSLGAASVVPLEPHGAPRLIEMADRFLYAAKRGGRNRVVSAETAESAKEGVLF